MNDLLQYENNYIVQTKTRHRMPVVRTTSITNVDESLAASLSHKRTTSLDLVRQSRLKRASVKHRKPLTRGSGSSSPEPELGPPDTDTDSDSAGQYIPLAPGIYIKCVIFNLILRMDFCSITCKQVNTIESTLVQARAWCCWATSQYLNWCSPRSMIPYGFCRGQYIDGLVQETNTLKLRLSCTNPSICHFFCEFRIMSEFYLCSWHELVHNGLTSNW